MDPYGLVKKVDHIVKQSDERFKWVVNQIIPNASKIEKANIKAGLSGAITTHQIAKIMRHMLEIVKKYKIYQLAILVQMQIPIIKSIAKAANAATRSFADGNPIGDSIGPLVIANLTKHKPKLFKDEEFVLSKAKIRNKTIFLCKANGPGANTGKPGKFLQKVIKRNRIKRLITVDAAAKMEGEKTGSVAEGVGVAMGGIGVERYAIEDVAVRMNIPLDAVAIKMSQEEALKPMAKEVFKAIPAAIEKIEESVKRAGKERILIMGIGNTCGVGNSKKDVPEAEKRIKKIIKKMEMEKKQKKGKSL
jgi:hypothetical protein